ncbi:hypothetical protein [Roseimicrobium sp. ORNL1]|uniref:hypothetical protein n=1 Tax=Roseimicrobium sp. ORNL1 TaxID=2711231 RepID=UPI0013E178F5|nr:hypothetical protein [Roseimicrobium sp. ORNL1]QIF02048.1 hypothetical protein G5S37_11060 [Roseimicrobium sp. ORNL1]
MLKSAWHLLPVPMVVLALLLCAGIFTTARASWDRNEWLLQLDQAIKDPVEREKVKAAYLKWHDAKGSQDALKEWYAVDSSTAKMVAWLSCSYPIDYFEREIGPVSLSIPDLPLVLDWLIAHESTIEDVFANDSMGYAHLEMLEDVAEKWNALLKTTGAISSNRLAEVGNRWEDYSAQNLRRWAVKRIRLALAKGHWTEVEAAILRGMEEELRKDIAKGDFPRQMKWLKWGAVGVTGIALILLLMLKPRSGRREPAPAT